MGITYKELKEGQKHDIEARLIVNIIYRKFSTPFTFAFIRLRFSPEAVSILSYLPLLVGFYLLSLGTYAAMIAGLLFFMLFKILDCCDGEVARISNPNTMQSKMNMEGAYFDSVGHLIYPVCLGVGLGIGLFRFYNNQIYLVLGALLSILFALEYGLSQFAKFYLRRGVLNRNIKLGMTDKKLQQELGKRMNKNMSLAKKNIFVRLFSIYPVQGLFYVGEFIYPIAIILILIEVYANDYLKNIVLLQGIGLLMSYIWLLAFAKTIWIVNFIHRMKKKKYISALLQDLQNKKI